MPKRKVRVSRNKRCTRPRTSSPPQCPQLPQEIWDKIISLSMNIDTILGVIPDEVHRYFQSPFMHVSQACREGTIQSIASSAWIELRSLDHEHACLVHALAEQLPPIDSFWFPVLFSAGRVPRIVFEFGSKIHQRSTRQHDNDTQIFLSPYSYASVVWLISKLGPLIADIDRLVVSSEEMPPAKAHEIESVLAFLDADTTLSSKTKTVEFCYTFSGKAPLTMDSLYEFPFRILELAGKLDQGKKQLSAMRSKVLLLYMTQYLTKDAEALLLPPSSWVHWILAEPDHPDYTRDLKRLRFGRIFCYVEMSAYDSFQGLIKTDMEWIWYHSSSLTNGYRRFITEPSFTYYGISMTELAAFYRRVAHMTDLYNIMNKWLKKPIYTASPICQIFERKTAALLCASRLRPDLPHWNDEFLKAKAELIHYFPRHGWKRFLDDCCIYHFRDLDDEECVWYENPVCPWDRSSLPCYEQARQLIADFDIRKLDFSTRTDPGTDD